MVIIIILALQVMVKGATYCSICMSWSLCIILTNITLHLSNSDIYLWVNITILIVMGISYEIERNTISHFIHGKIAKDALKRVLDLELALANKHIIDGKRDLAATR